MKMTNGGWGVKNSLCFASNCVFRQCSLESFHGFLSHRAVIYYFDRTGATELRLAAVVAVAEEVAPQKEKHFLKAETLPGVHTASSGWLTFDCPPCSVKAC